MKQRCLIFVFICIFASSTFVFAEGTPEASGNPSQNKIEVALNDIDDPLKKEQIIQLLEPIYVSSSGSDARTSKELESDTLSTINELSKLSTYDLEKRYIAKLGDAVVYAKNNTDIYFTESGLAAVKKYFPNEINNLPKVQADVFGHPDGFINNTLRWPDRSYTKRNTVAWHSLQGVGFTLTVSIFWTVKNNKIVFKSSSASTTTNGLWKRKSLSKTIDKIDYRGFGHIKYKAVFQRLAGAPILRHAYNGAWFYIDGGCDWN